MKFLTLLSSLLLFSLIACTPAPNGTNQGAEADTGQAANPPAPGFNLQESDSRAIAIADSVMLAMGGRAAWDEVRYLRWTFFGRRTLLWDKYSGRVRISMNNDSTLYLLDLNDRSGAVKQAGQVLENPDSVTHYLNRAEAIWINDTYWLVMPYKLKDTGVTLTYLGRDTTQEGNTAEVLQLTFEEVGKTPENKYHILVDPGTYRVVEWRYFSKATDAEPAMATPWRDYRPYDGILLSGDRGRARLTDIAVYETVPESAFTSLDPIDAAAFR